jgi:4-diphosphocytidyl-2-C-methyl-D-erythritol kinase
LTLALPARAKLNLDLEVLGRRDDGFHEVRTRLQSIDLHDLLLMAPADRTTITTSGLEVKTSAENSVLKAHAALERAVERELATRFLLHKRIPPGSGLGGASSDAATALRGLAQLHHVKADLAAIAAALGADVPFFLIGGDALAEGRGDQLTHLTQLTHQTRLAGRPSWFAIAWPGIELSTAAVYRAWDEVGGDPPNGLRRAAARVDGRLDDFARRLGPAWQMTGSGSAFFLTCGSPDVALRSTAALDCWTAVTHAVGPWG